MINKLFALSILSAFLFSCAGIKLSGTEPGKTGKLYEEFFVEQGVTQYFISPLEFKSQDETLEIDFTFRNGKEENPEVTVNFSIFSSEPFKALNNASLKTTKEDLELVQLQKLFIELKKEYVTRYSSKTNYNALKAFIKNGKEIKITSEENQETFVATKKTVKNLSKLNTYLIEILELN